MKLWKVLGLAGLAGVAAGGVAVARAERRRRAYEPDDVRARLHERHRQALLGAVEPPLAPGDLEPAAVRLMRWARFRAALHRRRRR